MRNCFATIVLALGAGSLAFGPAIAAEINPPRTSPAKPVAPSEAPVAPPAAEQAVPRFEQERPLTAAALKKNFPADYQSLVSEFARIGNIRVSPAEQSRRGAEVVIALASRYSPDVAKAPPETTRDIIERFVALHEAVLAGAGPETCAMFSRDGSMVLYTSGVAEPYLDELDALGAVFFQGVADARIKPTNVEEAQDADWAALTEAMQDKGDPESFFESLGKQDTADPQFCPAIISMMKQMAVFEGEAGERLRASLATSAAVY